MKRETSQITKVKGGENSIPKPRQQHVIWVNVFQDGALNTYSSKSRADETRKLFPLFAQVKISIDCEEGEGLES